LSRRVLYVAHPLAPTNAEIAATPWAPLIELRARVALKANIDRALRWLAWLRKGFPETTFIAPWIATIQSLGGDGTPEEREAGLVDDCAVVERCDGIVLCGSRISSGMRREVDHGSTWRVFDGDDGEPARFERYDLTHLGPAPPPDREPGGTFDTFFRGGAR
jgi:hypothetical protein